MICFVVCNMFKLNSKKNISNENVSHFSKKIRTWPNVLHNCYRKKITFRNVHIRHGWAVGRANRVLGRTSVATNVTYSKAVNC